MLTVILLVVLGGGVGWYVVSSAETQKTATAGRGSPRAKPKSARRRSAPVPAGATAVEGAYADLVRPSLPRRLVSLILIALLVTVLAVTVAAVIGGGVGIAARILNRAI